MSEILVDNLTGKTSAGSVTVTSEGGAATQSLQQGLAKVWGLYDQIANTTDSSFNVSSITDSSAGTHTVAFSNNLSARGCVTGLVTRRSYYNLNTADAITTSDVDLRTDDSSDAARDREENCFAVHGDLA